MIVLKSELTVFESYQMVFERCFENNIKEQTVSHIFGDGGHCLWLQGPLNLFTREQRANYIAAILLHILELLNV